MSSFIHQHSLPWPLTFASPTNWLRGDINVSLLDSEGWLHYLGKSWNYLARKAFFCLNLDNMKFIWKRKKKIPHLKSLKASNIALKLPSPKQCSWRRKSCHPENVVISSICSLKLDAHLTRNHWAKTYLSIWAGELHFSPNIPWCHTSSATNQQRTAFKMLRICMHFREEAQRY